MTTREPNTASCRLRNCISVDIHVLVIRRPLTIREYRERPVTEEPRLPRVGVADDGLLAVLLPIDDRRDRRNPPPSPPSAASDGLSAFAVGVADRGLRSMAQPAAAKREEGALAGLPSSGSAAAPATSSALPTPPRRMCAAAVSSAMSCSAWTRGHNYIGHNYVLQRLDARP